ncbi:MAG: hypothetical protein HY277_01935 [Ignavibacteriales bacterium]|nr:hypothetical protein [Ignavibacteriales bacterium]
MRILTVVVCFAILICGFACKETPPQPYVQSVFLSVEDAGVTAVISQHEPAPTPEVGKPASVYYGGQVERNG